MADKEINLTVDTNVPVKKVLELMAEEGRHFSVWGGEARPKTSSPEQPAPKASVAPAAAEAQAEAASAREAARSAEESSEQAHEAAAAAGRGGESRLHIDPEHRLGVERDESRPRWKRYLPDRRWGAVLGAIVLLILAGYLFWPAPPQGQQSVSLSLENQNKQEIDGLKTRMTALEQKSAETVQAATAAQHAAEDAKKDTAKLQTAVAGLTEKIDGVVKEVATLKPVPKPKPIKKVSAKKIPNAPLPPKKPKRLVRPLSTTAAPIHPTSLAALPPSIGCPPEHPVVTEFQGRKACGN